MLIWRGGFCLASSRLGMHIVVKVQIEIFFIKTRSSNFYSKPVGGFQNVFWCVACQNGMNAPCF